MDHVDVAILGAGPAGCCATLRMIQLGYRVALIERTPFPRPQIGESVSPGIFKILNFLDAPQILDQSNAISSSRAIVIWENPVPGGDSNIARRGLLLDRASFDHRLLALAQRRGAMVYCPAKARIVQESSAGWHLSLDVESGNRRIEARILIVATGRGRSLSTRRVHTAPAIAAIWNHCPVAEISSDTRIEAVKNGWIWGAATAGGQYRVMTLARPDEFRSGREGIESAFRGMLRESALFKKIAAANFTARFGHCAATPFISTDLCRANYFCAGESALAIDPLSSAGVETSMKLALKAAVAANTALRNPAATTIASEYYEFQVLESAAAHAHFAHQYYASAWPHPQHEFWIEQANDFSQKPAIESQIFSKFEEALIRQRASDQTAHPPKRDSQRPMHLRPADILCVSPRLTTVESFCVRDDVVGKDLAISHPNLRRPIRFLDGLDLVKLLSITPEHAAFEQMMTSWAAHLPLSTAVQVGAWLIEHGLIESVRPF